MHGLKQAGKLAFWVAVPRRRDSDCPCACRAQVAQNVAKQIAADDDVELLRAKDEESRQNIDVELVDLQVSIIPLELLQSIVPVRHRDTDPVALRRASQVLLRPALRELKCI